MENQHKLPAYSLVPQVEHWLEKYLGHKAPQLPDSWRHAIAKYGPWLILISLVLSLPSILAWIGLSIFPNMPMYYARYMDNSFSMPLMVVTMITMLLEAMALPGLFKRSKQGWALLFYAVVISTIMSILSFNVGGFIGNVICLYVVFQIKGQYHRA